MQQESKSGGAPSRFEFFDDVDENHEIMGNNPTIKPVLTFSSLPGAVLFA